MMMAEGVGAMDVIRTGAVMGLAAAFLLQTGEKFAARFSEQFDHSLSRRLIEDGGQRPQVFDAAFDVGEHVLGRRAVEEAVVSALDVDGRGVGGGVGAGMSRQPRTARGDPPGSGNADLLAQVEFARACARLLARHDAAVEHNLQAA